MEELLKKYRKLVAAVFEAHRVRGMQKGHNFDHTYSVANLAWDFCEDDSLKKAAFIAGLFHNADRMIAFDENLPNSREVPDDKVDALVRGWLTVEDLTEYICQVIIKAVLNHGKPNDDSDDTVTVALKDADRAVNARIDVVIRSAQFRSNLPVIDPVLLLEDFRGKYNDRLTVVADLLDCLDWGKDDPRFGVRTQKAKKMIASRVAALLNFFEMIVEQRKEEGLVPYPEEFAV